MIFVCPKLVKVEESSVARGTVVWYAGMDIIRIEIIYEMDFSDISFLQEVVRGYRMRG